LTRIKEGHFISLLASGIGDATWTHSAKELDMQTINLTESFDGDFVRKIECESGQDVSLCYQCGNCTAGCPYTFVFDIPVNQVMRLLQAGQKRTLLSCKSIWLCATCESCTTRCPNNIDVARIMDVLRHEARRQGYASVRSVKVFWDAFLDSVKRHGRVFEMGLAVSYIAQTGRFWTDVELSPPMLSKGKLGFTPHNIQGRSEVKKIFERFQKQKEQ
jgi:heterodisulfide reductase subunit C